MVDLAETSCEDLSMVRSDDSHQWGTHFLKKGIKFYCADLGFLNYKEAQGPARGAKGASAP